MLLHPEETLDVTWIPMSGLGTLPDIDHMTLLAGVPVITEYLGEKFNQHPLPFSSHGNTPL